MRTIVYESAAPLTEGQRFMAFLVHDWARKDKTTGTVSSGSSLLPVRFVSDSSAGATSKALAFWKDETAKEWAKKERGAALGKSRNKTA